MKSNKELSNLIDGLNHQEKLELMRILLNQVISEEHSVSTNNNPDKWKRFVNDIESIDWGDYAAQIEKESRDFRENFEFREID